MKLTPPKRITFWISVVLAVIGLIAFFLPMIWSNAFAFWSVFVAYLLLALGLLIKGF